MKHGKSRRKLIACCAVLLAFFTTIYAYADEYYGFRDGDIKLVLPDNWDVTEIEAQDSEGKLCEHILTAQETDSDQPLKLDVYFSYDEVFDDEYFYISGDEDEALDYYDLYGSKAIENLYSEYLMQDSDSAGFSWDQSEFFDGEWNGFLKVDVYVQADIDGDGKEEKRSDIVYITPAMTDDSNYVVNEMLVFNNGTAAGLSSSDRSSAENIADEFYDYGYETAMTGDYRINDYDEYDDFDIGEAAMSILSAIIPLIVVVVSAAAAVRFGTKRKNGAKAFKLAKDNTNTSWTGTAPQSNFKKAERKTKAKPQQSKQTVYRASSAQTSSGADIERGYMESLKTLYKSGLLTKSEMNEMLEKHQQRNNRRGG